MTDSDSREMTSIESRVEIAARALARHRLTHNEVWQKATELRTEMLDRAVENHWRQLVPEVRAILVALDQSDDAAR
jgi:flagellar motor switch protein FliM